MPQVCCPVLQPNPAPLRRSAAVQRPRSPSHVLTASLQGPRAPVDLPGGGVWLGPNSSKESFLPGPGYTFLILRDKVGGEGLVVRPPGGPKPLHVRRQQQAGGGQLAPWRVPQKGGLSLAGLSLAGSVVVIDTEFELLEEGQQQEQPAIEPNTTCTGIVPLSWLSEEQEGRAAASKHPRRTQRVRFTCNLCGTTNEKETNPHAWQHGSVFMRCDGCSAVHKVRDNLEIFHEVKGPIFPPRHLRNSFLIQEILDKIDARRRAGQGEEEGGLLN